ncbi:heat stress transcription factor B-4-like [Olea europaea subsp. europaea]|uniref:Heat stress transcription factor B-4-like n=1 Tax=Olea europaea subsp. europaea TaxID=158383 RepID=A0A8S0TEE7_OLEEU|nr:heat stress transcription factor B-4-like [Olea europaea subsp. europaea]
MDLMLDNYEGILLSLESQKSAPAPFLTKTYQLVDDPTTNHIVSWGEDDTTFVVWRPSEFARDLLPNYFKHSNFSSFVRQLNTYGFRKIVPDRWEFANDFFKKGEKKLLCEIHRRKTAQPQVDLNHHHHHHHLSHSISSPSFSQYTSRVSISLSDSDEQLPPNWCDSPPLSSPTGISVLTNATTTSNNVSVSVLSEDNQKLRKRNNMLISELSHMRKLYNDIIYFVQNHVKPVAHSNSYPSLFLCNSSAQPSAAVPLTASTNSKHNLKAIFQPEHSINQRVALPVNSTAISLERPATNSDLCNTKLFGVQLPSKKRLHSEFSSSVESKKARLILEKDDLRLNLMPPFPC